MWNKIWKTLAGILLAPLLGWLALTLVYMLPEEPMTEHTREHKTVNYAYQCMDGMEPGVNVWVDQATPSSATDSYTDALMINTAIYPADGAPWQDALVNHRYAYKIIEKLLTRPEIVTLETPVATLQNTLKGEIEGVEVEHYARYWNGYLLWLKPALYAFSFSKVRSANAVLQIILAFWLFTLLHHRIGKLFGWAFLLTYLMLNPVTLAMSFQYAPAYYLATIFSILLLYHEKWVGEGKVPYLLTAAGIATAYFDFLTYPLFSYGLPMAIALLIAHRKGLLIKTFDGVKRVIEGGIFWIIGYGGMYISKWALATAFTDINVFADALTQLTYRMSNAQKEADFAANFGLSHVLIKNLWTWINTPAFIAFAIFVIAFAVLRIVKLRRKAKFSPNKSVILGLLLLCLSPFVWYDVMLNHSYLHFWFTYREMGIFAFAFASLMILRTEEK